MADGKHGADHKDAVPDQVKLTPTEDLILDVLATRARTGELFWSVSTKLTKQLRHLSELGYLHYESGPIEHCWRVWLDDKGRTLALVNDYETPHVRKIISLRGRVRRLQYPAGSLLGANQDGMLEAYDDALTILRNVGYSR